MPSGPFKYTASLDTYLPGPYTKEVTRIKVFEDNTVYKDDDYNEEYIGKITNTTSQGNKITLTVNCYGNIYVVNATVISGTVSGGRRKKSRKVRRSLRKRTRYLRR